MRSSLLLALLLAAPPLAHAQGPRTPSPQAAPTAAKDPSIELTPSVTRHTITLKGAPLAYTATAAQIPLQGDTGEVECRMFYIGYTKDGVDPSARPVTFAFNGGPGSASLWLHMGALGPKRAPMNDDGSLPKPPYTVVDNAETWLDFTDVVCVDAPATGYSRLARRDLGPKYFGMTQDIDAFTQFVKNWLKEHRRWRSPVFIAGESYGGIRGSGLCASLFQGGVAVNGFISISGVSNMLTLRGMRGNDTNFVGFLPTLAATAWYHNKVSHAKYKEVGAFVNEVRQWTDTVYGPALLRGDSLSDAETDKVAEKMALYLGLSKKLCLQYNLKIPEFLFFRELLRDEGKTVGRYDGRLVGKDENPGGGGRGGGGDPSDEAVTPPFVTSVNDYLGGELGIKTEMPYLTSGSVQPWQYPQGSYGETSSDLSRLLLRNPHFRVLYCMGYYDLACPLNATLYTVNHLGLDKETRSHISYAYYPAGHMMYIEKGSRIQFHDDAARFVAETLKGK